jgi:hypothetical protein
MSAHLPAMRWKPAGFGAAWVVSGADFGFRISSFGHELVPLKVARNLKQPESSGRSNPFRRGDAWRWEDIFDVAPVQWLCVQIFIEPDLIELNVKPQSRPQAHSGSDRHFRYHALERGYWGRRE